MPDGTSLCLDLAFRTSVQLHDGRPGWEVTGTPPQLTVSPSILLLDYHGWLRDGVISDDIEGRRYGEP